MNRWDNHTFVICAYGDSSFLHSCVKSLLNQTLKSNVILYTSTPSEFIQKICEEEGIEYFFAEGGGIGKDWNLALSFVKTQYATIAHQDDYYEPTYLENIFREAQKHKEAIILYSDYFEEKNGKKIKATVNLKIKSLMLRTLSLFPISKCWRIRVLAFGNPICCPAVTYNLSITKDFSFSETMRVSLDWYAWYQLSKLNGSFRFIPEKLMCHRIHEESETSNTIKDNTRTNEDLQMYSLFWPKFIAKLLNKFYIRSQKTNN